MDWLHLGIVLLVVVGSIEAQQGYSYPKPKTPFSEDDISTGDRTSTSFKPSGGFPKPTGAGAVPKPAGSFGGQQPSGEYPDSRPTQPQSFFDSQRPGTSYSGSRKPDTQQSFVEYPSLAQPAISSSTQRPFGSQQFPAGYTGTSISTQAPFGQTGSSTGFQRPFGTQQPSTGYPTETQPGISTGEVQQPSIGYTGSSGQPGTTSSVQRSFSTQQPTAGYPGSRQPETNIGTGFQRPSTGYSSETQSAIPRSEGQQPSVGLVQPGSSSTQRSFGTQQSTNSYSAGTQPGSFIPKQPSTDYPDVRQPGSQQQSSGFIGTGTPGTDTLTGQQRPIETQGSLRSFPGQQAGYKYPTPQRPFSGTAQIGSTERPGSLSSGTKNAQFPGGTRPSEQSGDYPSFDEQRPIKKQFPFSFSRSGEETPGEYSRQEPQGSQFLTGVQGAQRGQEYTGQQGIGGRRPLEQVPIRPTGYTGETTSRQFPSDNGTPPGTLKDQEFPRRPVGYSKSLRPTETQFPASGPTQSPDSPQNPTGQFPSSATQVPTGSLEGGLSNGFSTTPLPFSGFSRSQLPLEEKPNLASYPKKGERPISSYLPPGQQGTGNIPSSGTPISQFPSKGFTSPDTSSKDTSFDRRPSGSQFPFRSDDQTTRFQNEYGVPGTSTSIGAKLRPEQSSDSRIGYGRSESQFSSGVAGQPSHTQNGYGSSNAPTSINGKPLGSELPSEQPTSSQEGTPSVRRPSTSTSQFPSVFPQQPIPSQNGYSTSGTITPSRQPSESELPYGLAKQPTTQGGYGTSVALTPTGGRPSESQFTSGQTRQPIHSQNDYGRLGTPTSVRGRPSESELSSKLPVQPSQNGYGISKSSPPIGGRPSDARVSSGLSEQSTRPQNEYGSSDESAITDGRPSGSQFTSEPSGQSKSRPQNAFVTPGSGSTSGGQIQQGYPTPGKSFTGQQLSRPGSAGRSETGFGLEGRYEGGSTQQIDGQTFPESQQNFSPEQRIPSNQQDKFGEEDEVEGDYSAIPGEPGRDYPILSEVPDTSFNCDDQEFRGYYADVETRCQIFHICANDKTYDFLCPNGTIFHQEHLVCVWWNQFDCNTAPSLYRINEHIYDYSIIGAQQTGGILVPGQGYPDVSEVGLGAISRDGIQGQQRPDTGIQGLGGGEEQDYPSQGQRSGIVQRPEGYPSQGLSIIGGSQTPNLGYQRPGTGIQTSGGRFQELAGVSSRHPSDNQQGTREYQPAKEGPGEAITRPTGTGPISSYSDRLPARSDTRYPGRQLQSQAYPSEKPIASDETQGFVSGQRPAQFRNEGKPTSSLQTIDGNERPQEPGFPSTPESRRSGGSGTVQNPTTPQESRGYSGERPGQYGGQGISKSTLPVGSQTTGEYPTERPQESSFPTGPGGYKAPTDFKPQSGTSESQQPSGYSTGTSPRPGFPSGFSTVTPSGPGSPFSGSAQPHQSTREYLPPVS